ncbi:MAG: hypothetical protein A3F09_00885 [Chlamydiae bacterium RIFCSPHIGHO2_12_FULL_49_11]|nr:MAG: hypothetical protein A3F09_00885 [Chlamydiae bacterium RIFCSPHIGHO2_12_FULL_49_11]
MTRVVELESYEKDSNLRAVDLGKAEMKDERERCDGIWLTIGGVLITALGVLLLLGGLGIFGPVSSLALGWILGLSAGVLIGAGSLSVIVGPLLIAQTNSEFNHEKKCLRKQKKDEERIRQSHRMYLEEDITALQRAFKEINPQTVPMDYLIISEMCKNFAEKLGKRELVDFYEGFSMSLAEQQIPTPVSPSQ